MCVFVSCFKVKVFCTDAEYKVYKMLIKILPDFINLLESVRRMLVLLMVDQQAPGTLLPAPLC